MPRILNFVVKDYLTAMKSIKLIPALFLLCFTGNITNSLKSYAQQSAFVSCERVQSYASGSSKMYQPCRDFSGNKYKSFAAYCYANKDSDDPRRSLGCPDF